MMETPPDSLAQNGSLVYPPNPYLKSQEVDNLFHIGFSTDKDDLPALFGDIKFVCMGGSSTRIRRFAEFLVEHLNSPCRLIDLCRTDRFALYKVGCVLCVSHGMGIPSISILIHELIKLVHYARCQDVIFIRMGTSGGVGVKPGSVIVTGTSLNETFEPIYKMTVLGKPVDRRAKLSQEVAHQLLSAHDPNAEYDVIIGNTMCTSDFFEGQGRIDGAICEHTPEQRKEYLESAYKAGVRNIEMESLCLAGMCHMANIKAAVVCVTLLDRLLGDQITISNEEHLAWELRPQELLLKFFKKQLGLV